MGAIEPFSYVSLSFLILDSLPLLLAPLPPDKPLSLTLRRCRASTYHLLLLAHLFAGHFLPYDAARSVASRTFTPFFSPFADYSFLLVVYIVSAWTRI